MKQLLRLARRGAKWRRPRLLWAMIAGVCMMQTQTTLAEEPISKVHRFVLIVGANDGGQARVALRYASSDAERFGKLTEQLGGVRAGDVIRVLDSSRASLERGLSELRGRIQAARTPGVRTEAVFYYSGHSDGSGLLLGEARYNYQLLKDRIATLNADVKIAILDSCASGAFTRTKGGVRLPPFVVDESSQVSGYAFIASSSDTEAAQESDSIRASFFTHYLLSGLRGGADRNGDGKVTLSEAYEYASNETTARTLTTQAGAQHPAYNMHLAGTGNLVMTDLRSTSASLKLSEPLDGRLFIRNDSGQLVVELNKKPGKRVMLALPSAQYSVVVQGHSRKARATLTLVPGQTAELSPDQLEPFSGEVAGLRGDNRPASLPVAHSSLGVSVIPSLALPGPSESRTVSFNLLVGQAAGLGGVELGLVGNGQDGDVQGLQVGGVFNRVAGEVVGVQLTPGANRTHGLRGLGLGGLVNFNDGAVEGAQVSAGINRSTTVTGIQLGGLGNIADTVNGVQLGLFNLARKNVSGIQIGVVNVAEQSDASIGLFNFIRNGYRALEVWSSDTAPFHLGLKLGGQRFYSLLAISQGFSAASYMGGVGLGLHTPLEGKSLDVDALIYASRGVSAWDLGAEAPKSDSVSLLGKLRMALSWPLSRELALSGGLALNVGWVDASGTARSSWLPTHSDTRGSRAFSLGPGAFAGAVWQPDWLH